MTRMMLDMSPLVQPGDTIYVSVLRPDGTPTGTGFRTTVDGNGRYDGLKLVTRGKARVDSINRPPKPRDGAR